MQDQSENPPSKRFGSLPAEVVTQLEGIADVARLEELADAVVEVPDLESFRQRLRG